MSRSYKKNPYVTDRSASKKSMKRLANRRVRRSMGNTDEMPSHLNHKKMTESWDICDYRWRMTKAEAIEWYKTKTTYDSQGWYAKRWPTLDSWLNYWEKCYRRK